MRPKYWIWSLRLWDCQAESQSQKSVLGKLFTLHTSQQEECVCVQHISHPVHHWYKVSFRSVYSENQFLFLACRKLPQALDSYSSFIAALFFTMVLIWVFPHWKISANFLTPIFGSLCAALITSYLDLRGKSFCLPFSAQYTHWPFTHTTAATTELAAED